MVGGVTCVGVIDKGVNYVYDWAQSDEDVQRMSRVAESHPVPVLGTSRHGKSPSRSVVHLREQLRVGCCHARLGCAGHGKFTYGYKIISSSRLPSRLAALLTF